MEFCADFDVIEEFYLLGKRSGQVRQAGRQAGGQACEKKSMDEVSEWVRVAVMNECMHG